MNDNKTSLQHNGRPARHSWWESLRDDLADRFSLSEDSARQEETVDMICRGVEFRGTNLWVLIFATMIASLGLNVNSAAVIIGAMLVSPLMGPIMGVGLSLGINDFDLLKKSLRNFSLMVVVAIATTALMPPLCTAGFGLATGQFKFFIGAFYLFFINTVFIALATYMVVRMLKYHKKKFLDPARERYVKRIMLLITLLTFIPSVVIGLHMVRVSFFESAVDRYVQQEFQFEHTRVIECKKAYKHGDRNSRIELLLIGEPLGEEIIGNARAQLYNYGLQDVELIVRQARTGDRVDLKSLQLSYSELLDEKNAQIDELKQRLSKYKMKNIEYDDISREAGAVVPDIQSISLSKCLSYDVGGTVQDTLLICVVKSRQPMTEADAERLRRWLEVRTKIAQVKLYTE